jgi:predicted Fe-Mo cluster-binding NifX family protein
MKVAIATENGFVSAHFGRCGSYTIVEIKEGTVLSKEEIPNPGHQPGFLPQYLSEKGVNCIVAGGMGRRAKGLFAQRNIEAIIGVQGPVDEVIEKFKKQELEPGDDLCEHHHGREGPLAHGHHHEEIHRPTRTKICITSQGKDLEAEVDPSFGRAHYFLIVDPRTMESEAVENPNIEASQGAGIQTAQLVSSKNVGTVLTGSCGPNALRVLESSGIRVITGTTGRIKDVLQKYKSEVGE